MLTRIAPTPSGFLHLGNIMSFAITAAIAEKAGARILLRIDDLDRGRVNNAYVQDIFDTLTFMDIPWHEGPGNMQEFEQEWSQMHRTGLYKKALLKLQNKGKVFACNCSRAQIKQLSTDESYAGTCCNKESSLTAPDSNWRLHTDARKLLKVEIWPVGSRQAALPTAMQNFVVKKKDGCPAYQLSSLVDDLHFGVNLVVRGEDLWASTIAQHYLAGAVGAHSFEQIQFYHHILLTESGGIKLSKSAGATSVKYLREAGLKAEEIYQEIARMLGINTLVSNWYQLAAHLLQQR